MNKRLLFCLFQIFFSFVVFGQNHDNVIQFEKVSFDKSVLSGKFHKFELWKVDLTNSLSAEIRNLQIHLADSILSFIVENNNRLTKPDFVITANGNQFSKDASLLHFNTVKRAKNECRISVAKNFILGSFTIDNENFAIEQVCNFVKE
ncbi:MAG: hypothetical protein ACQUYJ_16730, partial [Ferruginibacter sp.]